MNSKTLLHYEESAEYLTNIKGWVCKTCKRYYGDGDYMAEHMARYCCAKDMPCECGNRREKHYLVCPTCRSKKEDEKYLKMEGKQCDGKQMIYSETLDRYFSNIDEIIDYVYDVDLLGNLHEPGELTQKQSIELKLILCDPVGGNEFDMQEFLCDSLPEDYELDCEDINKIVNKWIEDQGTLSWYPGKYRLLVE